MLFTDKITILRPKSGSSRYSTETVPDYSNVERIPVEELVSVQPASATEQGENRASTITGWRLTTPAGVNLDLLAIDQIEHAGRVLSVIGEPLRWPHPTRPGDVHHLEAALQVVSG
ncbi:hypothetical protein [Prescottella equi]|uniref:hypothetical protein n=1 Tax=Rhodococcus hoagii TaxID=43767 RepID=UPI0007CD8C26|nr:hypothetical protein [Prescottella equi]